MNNYERIKNMTIEEMAEYLANMECNTCCVYSDKIYCLKGVNCFTGIKQWLLEEVEDE